MVFKEGDLDVGSPAPGLDEAGVLLFFEASLLLLHLHLEKAAGLNQAPVWPKTEAAAAHTSGRRPRHARPRCSWLAPDSLRSSI